MKKDAFYFFLCIFWCRFWNPFLAVIPSFWVSYNNVLDKPQYTEWAYLDAWSLIFFSHELLSPAATRVESLVFLLTKAKLWVARYCVNSADCKRRGRSQAPKALLLSESHRSLPQENHAAEPAVKWFCVLVRLIHKKLIISEITLSEYAHSIFMVFYG